MHCTFFPSDAAVCRAGPEAASVLHSVQTKKQDAVSWGKWVLITSLSRQVVGQLWPSDDLRECLSASLHITRQARAASLQWDEFVEPVQSISVLPAALPLREIQLAVPTSRLLNERFPALFRASMDKKYIATGCNIHFPSFGKQ